MLKQSEIEKIAIDVHYDLMLAKVAQHIEPSKDKEDHIFYLTNNLHIYQYCLYGDLEPDQYQKKVKELEMQAFSKVDLSIKGAILDCQELAAKAV